jgi:hypothetical protein
MLSLASARYEVVNTYIYLGFGNVLFYFSAMLSLAYEVGCKTYLFEFR